MATTMKLIAKTTLGSSASTVTFSDIPQTYTDLLLMGSARDTIALTYSLFYVRPNGSTTGGTFRHLVGNGSTASSSTEAGIGVTIVTTGYGVGSTATANTFANFETYIPNYAGSTNKTISSTSVGEDNATTAYMSAVAGLWSNTAAITSLVLQASSAFAANSSFFLYGITKA